VKSLFFVPVFNQVREFPRVLSELRESATCDTVLFVNNGSSDGSESLVRNSGFPYLDLERNRGVGYSYIVAADWAIEHGYDVFGTMASNGKMLAEEMPRVLEPVTRGEAHYVSGSRFLPGGGSPHLPGFRRRAIPWVNVFARLCTGARLTDATCGYRAFRLDLLRAARFDWHADWLFTYGVEYYVYAKVLLDRRLRSIEVPVTMRYPEKGPYSKIRGARDWWAMLKPWVAARLSRRGFDPARSPALEPAER
jgi:glycosyltransferase involved in cell wall biosynthesis